ncbi:MAG: hypothetical protein ACKOPS_09810, partial [Cyanobium sp.]
MPTALHGCGVRGLSEAGLRLIELLLGAGSGFSKPQKAGGASPLVDALSRLTPAQRSEYIQG